MISPSTTEYAGLQLEGDTFITRSSDNRKLGSEAKSKNTLEGGNQKRSGAGIMTLL